jgi:hypothetical protein
MPVEHRHRHGAKNEWCAPGREDLPLDVEAVTAPKHSIRADDRLFVGGNCRRRGQRQRECETAHREREPSVLADLHV